MFDWVALLPASDDPASLIRGVELLFDLDFYRSRIVPEFRGLRLLAEEERISIMGGVVAVWPEYLEQHEFYDALRDPSVLSLDLILDAITGRIGQGHPERGMQHDFAESLFYILQERDRSTLMGRYEASTHSREREFLGHMLLVSGEHAIFVDLMATEVGRSIIAQSHYRARGRLRYTKHPHEDASVYELLPRNLDHLRRDLFELVLSDNADASAFAARYLDRIDGGREAEGMMESGRRHPKIETGQPWPLLGRAHLKVA